MIIHDCSIIGIPIFKPEAEPPLFVDTDTELAPSFSLESLKTISRRYPQHIQCCRGVKLGRLSLCDTLKSRESPYPVTSGKPLCIIAVKAAVVTVNRAALSAGGKLICRRY